MTCSNATSPAGCRHPVHRGHYKRLPTAYSPLLSVACSALLSTLFPHFYRAHSVRGHPRPISRFPQSLLCGVIHPYSPLSSVTSRVGSFSPYSPHLYHSQPAQGYRHLIPHIYPRGHQPLIPHFYQSHPVPSPSPCFA